MEELKKQEEYAKVVKPVIEWLNKNSNPHTIILITTNHAELLRGEYIYQTDEYIK